MSNDNYNYNWDAIAAVVAALIGLLAIFISGYTAWNVRQQTRAQVWPYLQLGESDYLPSQILNGGVPVASQGGALEALNKGVGPAIVRSVEVLVDGKPQQGWGPVFKALGYHSNPKFEVSSFDHEVLSPGNTLNFFVIFGQKAWMHFKSKFVKHVTIRTCYCSTLGDCWTSTLDFRNLQPQGQPVSSCSGVPADEQFAG